MVFRKDIFDKHNIPYPDKNWTWKDFMQICKKTTDISKNKYGLRSGSGPHESWWWTSFLWSAGGEVATYNNKTKRWEYAFDSDAAVKALDFYTQLSTEKHIGKDKKVHRGYTYKNFKNAKNMWERGDIAMESIYIEKILITNIDLKKYRIVPLPLGPTGIRGGELNNRMYGINSQGKNAAIKDAAWEYMLYQDSLRSQKILVEYLVKDNKGTLINPLYLKKFGHDSIAKKVDKKLVETLNISIATGVPEPCRAISSNHAYDFMTYALNIAAKMARQNKLAPIGSKTRYKQLKLILTRVCAYANKINNQQSQKHQKSQ
jgi:ABC-type glycerol-3-phosphate transport system substrate-binding protein